MSAIKGKISVEPGAHAVHFYGDDADLVGTVGPYLVDALAEDAVAVVIATGPHIEAFEQELAFSGVDVEEARASGALIVLDAANTLSDLTVEGEINREAFELTVGGIVRDAGGGGRAVRAYGEMVDLLWQAGRVSEAIELEKLWNDVIEDLRFSLLCAYRSEASEAPEQRHALNEICRLHSAVSRPPVWEEPTSREVSREFDPEVEAPGAARQFLEEELRPWVHADTRLDDARLLLSELVTNAVTHAGSPFLVSIRAYDSAVRLAVRDQDPTEPTVRPWDVDADSGRGLQIVAALSRDWGVEATPLGKTVWAEL